MRDFIETAPNDRNRASLAPLPSDTIDVRVLAANTAEVHTIPSGANFVVFSATADFYVRFGAAAAVPAADVTDGTGSALNPAARRIPSGTTTIGIVAPTDCIVTLSFYG